MAAIRFIEPRVSGRAFVLMLALMLIPPAVARAGTGLTWSAAIPVDHHAAGTGLTGVACPSTTQCTGIDQRGTEVTFNPQAPAAVSTLSLSSALLTAVACPSVTQCTAVDSGGHESSFDPQTAQLIGTAAIDSKGIPWSVDCPTSSQCTAVDLLGNEASFNPTTGATVGTQSLYTIDSGRSLAALDCTSTTACTAVDTGGPTSGPTAVSFDPTKSQVTGETSIPAGQNSSAVPVAIGCQASASNCVVVDSGGSLAVFGPATSSTSTIDSKGTPTALSCPSDSQCVAVDAGGNEISVDVSALSTGGVHPVDPGRVLTGVSCPASGQCTAVDSSGAEVTFDPGNPPSTPAPIAVDGSTRFATLACPTTGQCTAMDISGVEATFVPGTGAGLGAVGVDLGTTGVYGLSCVGTAQCTAVDNDGREVTFNPASPGVPTAVSLDPGHALFAVGCPLASQCTAVDDRGAELSFNPQNPGTPSPVTLDPGHGLPALSCPAATQCTAIDDAGNELTFNPQDPAAHSLHAVDSSPDAAIACPDVNDCVAVGAAGNEVTFNPNAVAPWTAAAAAGKQLTAVSCRTDHDCIAVGTAGEVLEGDPWGSAPWSSQQLTAGAAASGVACPSAFECVAADAPGDAFAGAGAPLPPVPVGSSAPAITGRAIQGQQLTELHGGWSQGPTSYSYQWLRCDPRGQGCAAITAATAQSYTLAAADVGHELRVQEWAANISGAGLAPVTSTATGVVRPLVPVSVSRLSLTLHTLHPRLRLMVTAWPSDPPVSTITISVKSGLSFARKALHTLSISTSAKKARFSAAVHGQSLRVRLRAAAPSVRVGIGGGLLVAKRQLVRRARSRKPGTTQIELTVVERGGTRTRLTLTVAL